MKRLRSTLLFFIPSIVLFSSCNSLHIHDYDSPYKYDENQHWQECSKCHEKFNADSHAFNGLDDTCHICGYKDPIIKKDENGVMVGLTPYGKTKKYTITIPSDTKFIGKDAFANSECATVYLKKEFIGFHKDAFVNSKVKELNTEEGLVEWTPIGDFYYKNDLILNNEALIDNVFYPTLEEALDDVKEHDTTITLLKNIEKKETLSIKYQITFESYQPSCSLKANFYITSGGSIKIPNNITYSGNTTLALGEFYEKIGDNYTNVYNSGSLVFVNKDTKPENVNVSYYEPTNDKNYTAVGAVQTVNEAVLIPKSYFAYGTFKLSLDLKHIVGLTTFGETVNGLNVTRVIENQDIEINDFAFVKPNTVVIHIPIHDIKIRAHEQKGIYRSVVIGDGVTSIGYLSFSNYFDSTQIPLELLEQVKAILCPLTSVTIGKTVKKINFKAFYYCAGLKSVATVEGSQLEEIVGCAFQSCFNLKTADFSKSLLLKKIGSYTFSNDIELTEVRLPTYIGWKAGACGFFPSEILPSNLAHLMTGEYANEEWTLESPNAKFCYYNPNLRDKEGRFNQVFYKESFADAYNSCDENSVIFLINNDENAVNLGDLTITKNVQIETLNNTALGIKNKAKVGNVTINPGKHLKLVGDFEFNENTSITLKTNKDGTLFKDVAGFALKSTNNSIPTVNYLWDGKYYVAKSGEASFNDGNGEYICYGLYDFNVANDSKTNCNITLRWLSQLGRIATKLTINDPVAIVANEDEHKVQISYHEDEGHGAMQGHSVIEEISFGEKVYRVNRDSLYKCANLRKVTFGKYIKYIGRWSFGGCEKLDTVIFNNENSSLEKFDTGAFVNCKSLKNISLPNQTLSSFKCIGDNCFQNSGLESFDFINEANAKGWIHNNQTISVETFKDKTKAANQLKTNCGGAYMRN